MSGLVVAAIEASTMVWHLMVVKNQKQILLESCFFEVQEGVHHVERTLARNLVQVIPMSGL